MVDLIAYIMAAVELPPGSFRTETVIEQAQSSDWLYKMISLCTVAAGTVATAYIGSPVAVVALNLLRELWTRPTQSSGPAPATGEIKKLELPELERDYSACFVSASTDSGSNRYEVWAAIQRTVENPQSWEIDLAPKERQIVSSTMIEWVNRSFARFHLGSRMDRQNLNHKVFVAYLYARCVDLLRAGEFGRDVPYANIADAIERSASADLISGVR
mgnify:CR=1 FL=1